MKNDSLLSKWLELAESLLCEFGRMEKIDSAKLQRCDEKAEHIKHLAALCRNTKSDEPFARVCQRFFLRPFEMFCLAMGFAFKNHYSIRQEILELQNTGQPVLFLDFCRELFVSCFGQDCELDLREEPLILEIFGICDEKAQQTIWLSGFVDAYIKGRESAEFCFVKAEKEAYKLPIQADLEAYTESLAKQKEQEANVLLIHGPELSGKKTQLKLLATKNFAWLLVFDFEQLCGYPEPELKKRVYEICLGVILKDAWLCFAGVNLRESDEIRVFKQVISIISPYIRFFCATSEEDVNLALYSGRFVVSKFQATKLSGRLGEGCWEYFLKKLGVSFENINMLARNFAFTVGQIEQAVQQFRLLGQAKPLEDMALKICRRIAGGTFSTKARRVFKNFGWEDLVVSDECKEKLQWICDLVKFADIVYEDLGFAKKVAYGRAVSALFYGPPGTGKTMAAQVVANELRRELYRVDLSQLVSKYVGETEKNLSEIFEAASRANVVLFFDEADSLFSKRTNISSSNDRFANIETSFLLQKIEEYSGVAILATNLAANFDPAFKRRLKVLVNFALPDENLRLRLWEKAFPEEAKPEELDFRYLAEKFEVSGSVIKSSAVAAAFLAVRAEKNLQMEHVMTALKLEISKNGGLVLENDFNI